MSKKNVKEYYNKCVQTLTEISLLQKDLKELTEDFKYDKDTNTSGVPKEELSKALKVARVYVEDNFSKKKEDWLELEESWKELVG